MIPPNGRSAQGTNPDKPSDAEICYRHLMAAERVRQPLITPFAGDLRFCETGQTGRVVPPVASRDAKQTPSENRGCFHRGLNHRGGPLGRETVEAHWATAALEPMSSSSSEAAPKPQLPPSGRIVTRRAGKCFSRDLQRSPSLLLLGPV